MQLFNAYENLFLFNYPYLIIRKLRYGGAQPAYPKASTLPLVLVDKKIQEFFMFQKKNASAIICTKKHYVPIDDNFVCLFISFLLFQAYHTVAHSGKD